MRRIYKLALRFRSLFHRGAVDREMEQELLFHIEQQTAINIAAGMPPEEARYAALRGFGGVDQIREECRDMRSVNWIRDFLQDVRFGIRVLLKSPGFALVAILTLALGIGANTAIFSLIDAALLRDLPVSDPQSLVMLRWIAHKEPNPLNVSSYGDCPRIPNEAGSGGCTFSEPLFREIQSQTKVFSSLAAFAGGGGLNLTGNGSPTTVDGVKYVSGSYFQTLGVRPQCGRLIGAADDAPSASPVVVLSHDYWKSQFASSESAVGKTIFLNRVPFTIVGVAEPRFDSLSTGNIIQMWLPLSTQPQIELPWDNRDADPGYFWLVIVGRLQPGTPLTQGQAAVNALFVNDMVHGAPKPMLKLEDNPALSIVPAQSGLTGETAELAAPMYVLMAAVGVVLLIACANVAGLLLSRASSRQKEMAVRFALGARRGRIVRQLLTESLLLSAAGGVLGIFFAKWVLVVIGAFVEANLEGPSPISPGIDARVLLFTAAVSILTGIIFGLAPALRSLGANLTPALKDAAGNLPSGRPLARWFSVGNTLVVAQVALTVIVLAAAGLLVRSLQNLRNVNPGFDTRNILTFSIDPTSAGYKRADIDRFNNDLQTRLAAMPGVTSVGYSWQSLLAGALWTTGFHLAGTPEEKVSEADMLPIGVAFLQTMRIPLRLGRDLNSSDFLIAAKNAEVRAAQAERVASSLKTGAKDLAAQNNSEAATLQPTPVIVNEALIHKYFPNVNPIGIRFGEHIADTEDQIARPGWVVVGVAGDAKYNQLRREVNPTIYAPATGQGTTFSLRTVANPSGFVPRIRSIVGQLDANLPINRIRTQSQQIETQLFAERLVARLSSFFGLLALLLSCIGLYGLLAFEVARRTREIGIRIALGARSADVLRLVIGQGLALTAVGAAIGIGAALGVTQFLGALLFGVHPADPLTFAAVAFLLAAVALLACYIPARRAIQVDPIVALRYE
jgi:predicted permease